MKLLCSSLTETPLTSLETSHCPVLWATELWFVVWFWVFLMYFIKISLFLSLFKSVLVTPLRHCAQNNLISPWHHEPLWTPSISHPSGLQFVQPLVFCSTIRLYVHLLALNLRKHEWGCFRPSILSDITAGENWNKMAPYPNAFRAYRGQINIFTQEGQTTKCCSRLSVCCSVTLKVSGRCYP